MQHRQCFSALVSDLTIKMKTAFIYALKEPETGEIRYIGKANDPQKRFLAHLRREESNHRVCWIKKLLQAGKQPQLEIIDEIPFEYWQQLEVAYIEFFKESGCRLVNGTLGGDESLGAKASEETRRKLSEAHKRIKKSPEWEEKVRLSHVGKKRSPETCSKISESKQNITEETRKKMRLAKLGTIRSEDAKRKQSESWLRKGEEKFQNILDLRKQGKTIREIAGVLGRDRTAVYAFLRRRKFCL